MMSICLKFDNIEKRNIITPIVWNLDIVPKVHKFKGILMTIKVAKD
jgi:hypothetical protein